MGALDDLRRFSAGLDAAITQALETDVADVVKQEMVNQIFIGVYDKYDPSDYERRYGDGGLADEENISIAVSGNTLIARNVTDGGRTVDIVESGRGYTWKKSKIFAMQPYPRPFHKPTEEAVITQGTAKRALLQGLARQGITAK